MAITVSFLIAVRHDPMQLACRIAEVQDYVDEIVVVHDGRCEDQTTTVARKCGCRVIIAPYEGYCEPQRKLGLEVCTGDWVLVGDADEVFTPEFLKILRPTIARAVRQHGNGVGLGRLELNSVPQEISSHVRLFERTTVHLSEVIHSFPTGLVRPLRLRGAQFVHHSITDGPTGDPAAVREKSLRYDGIQTKLRVKYADQPTIVAEFLSAVYNTGGSDAED